VSKFLLLVIFSLRPKVDNIIFSGVCSLCQCLQSGLIVLKIVRSELLWLSGV
jgi:hypothetical protein